MPFLFLQGQQKANDVTVPLHALPPDYPVPYGVPVKEEVKKKMDAVLHYLEAVTPAEMIDKRSGQLVSDVQKIDSFTIARPGDFRLTSYEWGVTYSAMQRAAEVTGDRAYSEYVKERFRFLSTWAPAVASYYSTVKPGTSIPLKQVVDPHALDDAGAVCASMIKAERSGLMTGLRPLIDRYSNHVYNKEYRLLDRTLARNRPQKNTLWLDDLYMAIPALAQMGSLTGDVNYFDDAVLQLKKYSERMFIAEKGLYWHGWMEGMEPHRSFHWARANGWAMLAMSELLDVLPEKHQGRAMVLNQFRKHVAGVASYQSGSGFWHQLLDRTDSYLETSATAIYAYCIAHGCNQGWLDPVAYAPMALLAWNAVSTKINAKGQVEGTCVGTGMAFDPAFYYHRPVSEFAAHGYGPVLMAGAEIYALAGKEAFRMNDSSLQFYK